MSIVWHPNTVSLVCLVMSGLVGALALIAWHQRTQLGDSPWLLLAGDWLCLLGFGVAAGIYELEARLFWEKVQFSGISLLVVGLILLTMSYAGYRRWLSWPVILLLALVPAAGVCLSWTNEAHHLIWAETRLSLRFGMALLNVRYGPFFLVTWVYAYLIVIFGIIVFTREFRRSYGFPRKQAAILLTGAVIPLLANVLYISGYSPLPGVNLTLPGFTLSAILTYWGFLNSRMLGLGAIPRNQVVEDMPDVLVVLDMHDRVIDINCSALRYLGLNLEQALGYSLQQLMPYELVALRKYQDVWNAHEQMQLGPPDAPMFFSMSITPLYDWGNHLYGRMCILRDTTELHLREIAIEEARAYLEVLNQRLVAEMASREMAQNQVFEQQRLLAVMEVRERLARDLHDNLGQVLGFFNMQAAAARQYLRDLDLEASDVLLAAIAETALDSQLELRDTIRELKSSEQVERRFFPSLALQIARFEQNYGIRVAQEIDASVKERGFDSIVSSQLLNILQESLNNIAKHASASSVRLVISHISDPSQAEIVIVDDGIGFMLVGGFEERSHYGLGFMKERALLVGGDFRVQSEPGQGTRITIRVPLRAIIPGENL